VVQTNFCTVVAFISALDVLGQLVQSYQNVLSAIFELCTMVSETMVCVPLLVHQAKNPKYKKDKNVNNK
jgi:hypothetical protein